MDPGVVRKCYAEITGLMQKTLDAVAQERPYPVLARLDELRPGQILRRLLRGETHAASSVQRLSQAQETKRVLSPRAHQPLPTRASARARERRAVHSRATSPPRRFPDAVGGRTSAALS